jgi:hypothetical protein
MEAGYRVFRVDASIGGPIVGNVFNTHERVRLVARACKEIREGVGEGDWMIDFHQKFDFADALRCCRLIEDYEPYLVEDPVRDEQALEEIPKLRQMTTCPLAHGEEWGQRRSGGDGGLQSIDANRRIRSIRDQQCVQAARRFVDALVGARPRPARSCRAALQGLRRNHSVAQPFRAARAAVMQA